MIGWTEANELSATYGESFFIFDEVKFRANFQELSQAFNCHYAKTTIGYSYKTNYTPYLCKIVDELHGYAEVVSEMEWNWARKLGVAGDRVIFNGPYKSKGAIGDALDAGAMVNLDSVRDLNFVLDKVKTRASRQFSVGVRCNFPISNDSNSRFGFDIEGDDFRRCIKAIAEVENLRLAGLHCHFPDRNLDSFGVRAKQMLVLASQIFPNHPPEFLNIGGGYFSGMPKEMRRAFDSPPASFNDYGELIGSLFAEAYGSASDGPRLFVEPGTALVADTFQFITRVIDIKTIRGRNIATVAGSIFDISPTARCTNLPVHAIRQRESTEGLTKCDIAGYTCIENDVMHHKFEAAIAQEDFIVFENVGSYSIVMKPPFILPANPILVARTDGGQRKYESIKRRETVDYIAQNFES